MTSAQILLVKKTWRLLRGVAPETIAALFYSKLFFDHPELRRMFPERMDEQHKKLSDMLTSMVLLLDDSQRTGARLSDLGVLHIGYGVKPKHYPMVGSALLWTLEKGLGDDWDKEAAAAWQACFSMVAESMQTAH